MQANLQSNPIPPPMYPGRAFDSMPSQIKTRVLKYRDPYETMAKAIPFMRSGARFCTAACASRSGKTFQGIRKAKNRMLIDAKYKPIPIDDTHRRYWAVAPDFTLSRKQERVLRATTQNTVLWNGENKQERTIYLHPDIAIEFKSEKSNLVADSVYGILLDEPALLKKGEEVWLGDLQSRIINTNGWVITTGTPRGRNWYYKHLAKPFYDGNHEYECFNWFTTDNTFNPNVLEEARLAKIRLPARYYKREWEGSWDTFKGQIYDEWNENIHIKPFGHFGKDYIAVTYSYDHGFAETHPGSLGVVITYPDGRKHRVQEVVAAHRTRTWWIDALRDLVERWGHGDLWGDPGGGLEFMHCVNYGDDVEGIIIAPVEGVYAQNANKAVDDGIQTMAEFLHPYPDEHGNLTALFAVDPSCTVFREEVTSYVFDEKGKPVKKDDHTMDDNRYNLHSAKKSLWT